MDEGFDMTARCWRGFRMTIKQEGRQLLSITEREVGDVTILDLEGSLIMGGGATVLRETISRLIEAGKKKLLLNFAGIKYVDSSGIGELVSSVVTVNHVDGQLKLFNLTERVEEVLSLSSLLSLFEVYTDEAQALEAFTS
jgi:anti-sigma B factor antagonist